MEHWTEKWLGQPYVEGEYDCLHFVRDVLDEEFNHPIRIPERKATGARGMAREIADLGGEVALPLVGKPDEGAGVLMAEAGWTRGGTHIGLWTAPGGRAHVLHNVRDLGSVLWPLDGLLERGWTLEGFYRWL